MKTVHVEKDELGSITGIFKWPSDASEPVTGDDASVLEFENRQAILNPARKLKAYGIDSLIEVLAEDLGLDAESLKSKVLAKMNQD